MIRPARDGRRLRLVMMLFTLAFAVIGARLVQLGISERHDPAHAGQSKPVGRPAILDRNGVLLATDVPSAAIYAEPRFIVDIDEAAEKLAGILPGLDHGDLYCRLATRDAFSWIKRRATPAEEQAVWNAGIPAVGVRPGKRRFYPNGPLAAHVIGTVDIDNSGIAGIERWIDTQGLADPTQGKPLPIRLTIDIRVQHALEDEVVKAVGHFHAKAGAGVVIDVATGEVLALASYPSFDPNDPADALKPDRINRVSAATFEMGSSFKALTTAMALEAGTFSINSVVDASRPLRFGRFRIRDYQARNRPLTVAEAFVHSSNIAVAKMAIATGPAALRDFLGRFGQTSRLTTELPESAAPLLPRRWREIDAATAAFGHGIAVTPLQASMGIAALVNGGQLIRPTFILGDSVEKRRLADNLVTHRTGEALRRLLRLNAEIGSARRADVPGYFIGGKTGTAEKVVGGRYSRTLNITSFMGVAPADDPRYLLLTMLDEPQALPETRGFRTSGWNAVPTGGAVFRRILPILGLTPAFEAASASPGAVSRKQPGSAYAAGR